MLSSQSEAYPKGPCGFCGEAETVLASSEYCPYNGHTTQVFAMCENCGKGYDRNPSTSKKLFKNIINFWGGKQGYAFGLNGPKLREAKEKAGWKRHKFAVDPGIKRVLECKLNEKIQSASSPVYTEEEQKENWKELEAFRAKHGL